MHRKKIGPTIIIIAFVVFICLLKPLGFVAAKFIDTENHENRDMAQRPKFTIQGYKTYTADYDKYFNDNIPFRNKLISINNRIDYYLFNKSSNDLVIKGTDGWLFHESTLEDYQHTNLCSERELEKIRE